ncbi:hypothetical protein BRAS3843_1560037 [Bradyrhizobium sp. STM 3843]|nr:hypothetical protein BRAS3843_1560037 [Bradyrhizobium sp. STM 3843]
MTAVPMIVAGLELIAFSGSWRERRGDKRRNGLASRVTTDLANHAAHFATEPGKHTSFARKCPLDGHIVLVVQVV